MGLIQQTPAIRFERAMHRAGGSAGISAGRKALAASAFGIVADGEVAGYQIDFFPIFVDEGCCGENARRKAQQACAAAPPVFLVERARQDLLLDAGRIAGRSRPSGVHIHRVEFEMGLVDGHRLIPPLQLSAAPAH